MDIGAGIRDLKKKKKEDGKNPGMTLVFKNDK